jgi:hypothetical protein
MRARERQGKSWGTTLLILLLLALSLVSPARASALSRKSSPRNAHPVELGYLGTHSRVSLLTTPCRMGACIAFCRTLPGSSAAPKIRGRIFVQDTPPPSLEPLHMRRIASAAPADGPRRPRSPSLRRDVVSLANRQRAP